MNRETVCSMSIFLIVLLPSVWLFLDHPAPDVAILVMLILVPLLIYISLLFLN